MQILVYIISDCHKKRDCLKALNIWSASQVCFVGWMSKINFIISIILYATYGYVCNYLPSLFWLLWENLQFSLLTHPIGNWPLFRVWSWNNCMRHMLYHVETIVWDICLIMLKQLYGTYALSCWNNCMGHMPYHVLLKYWDEMDCVTSILYIRGMSCVSPIIAHALVSLLCKPCGAFPGKIKWRSIPLAVWLSCYIDNHYMISSSWVIMPLHGWWYIIQAHLSSLVISKA